MKKLVSVLSVLVALCLVIGCFAACSKDDANVSDGNAVTDGNVVTDGNAAEEDAAESTDLLKVIDVPLTNEEYAFAVTKGNEELLASLNDFLAEIRAKQENRRTGHEGCKIAQLPLLATECRIWLHPEHLKIQFKESGNR